MADLEILAHTYSDQNSEDVGSLRGHILKKNTLPLFTGELDVVNGKIQNDLSVIHARSVAEEVVILDGKEPFTGKITVTNGKPAFGGDGVVMTGKSLLHSAPLTTKAFTKSVFGQNGKYIVSLGLLLFAFSTAISWSYYGDRAITFLVGSKGVVWYRIVYVAAFFFASFTDTTIVWKISYITIVVMTLPNLIGILLLRKDMKSTVDKYWKQFKKEWPDEKTPE